MNAVGTRGSGGERASVPMRFFREPPPTVTQGVAALSTFARESPPPGARGLMQAHRGCVLMLDIDGVLHPGQSGSLIYLPLLEYWLRCYPSVDVVFSSNWRLTSGFDELRGLLAPDLRPRVIGTTPVFENKRREDEILDLVWRYGIARWAALDDDASGFPTTAPCHLARTQYLDGLTVSALERVADLLRLNDCNLSPTPTAPSPLPSIERKEAHCESRRPDRCHREGHRSAEDGHWPGTRQLDRPHPHQRSAWQTRQGGAFREVRQHDSRGSQLAQPTHGPDGADSARDAPALHPGPRVQGRDQATSVTPQSRQGGALRSRRMATTLLLCTAPAIVTTALIAGCVHSAQQTKPRPRSMLMGYPAPVGVQQQRQDDGTTYFTPCDPCPAPSPKTAIEPADVAAAGTFPAPPRAITVAQASTPAVAPGPVPPEASADKGETLSVFFAYASAKLDLAARAALVAFAGQAKNANRVEVRGSTDATGSPQLNAILARARAEVVREDLVRQGVERKRIHAWGCVDCYAASNDEEAGRQANRRVDVILFDR